MFMGSVLKLPIDLAYRLLMMMEQRICSLALLANNLEF
jgi:hypothetical protein